MRGERFVVSVDCVAKDFLLFQRRSILVAHDVCQARNDLHRTSPDYHRTINRIICLQPTSPRSAGGGAEARAPSRFRQNGLPRSVRQGHALTFQQIAYRPNQRPSRRVVRPMSTRSFNRCPVIMITCRRLSRFGRWRSRTHPQPRRADPAGSRKSARAAAAVDFLPGPDPRPASRTASTANQRPVMANLSPSNDDARAQEV